MKINCINIGSTYVNKTSRILYYNSHEPYSTRYSTGFGGKKRRRKEALGRREASSLYPTKAVTGMYYNAQNALLGKDVQVSVYRVAVTYFSQVNYKLENWLLNSLRSPDEL